MELKVSCLLAIISHEVQIQKYKNRLKIVNYNGGSSDVFKKRRRNSKLITGVK
jgi:hypothetical protein